MDELDLSLVELDKYYVVLLNSFMVVATGLVVHSQIHYLMEELSYLSGKDTVFVKINNINFPANNHILTKLLINLN
jgi:hypothetical protein